MQKNRATAEMLDGTILGPERILFADKMRFENSARANGWSMTDEFRTQSFLTWAALERAGRTDLGYEAFLEGLADVQFEVGYQDEADESEDPTPADTSA